MSGRLATTAERLDEKAEKYERRTNTENKIKRSEDQVEELNRDLKRFRDQLDTLQFRTEVGVIVGTFDHTREDAFVEDALNQAHRVVDLTESELVDKVVDDDLEPLRSKISQAEKKVKKASKRVKGKLDAVQDTWTSRTASARQVLEIVGRDRELERTLDNIDTFVSKRMHETDNNINKLRSDWRGYTAKWEREGVDWSEFQDKQGLNDKTVKYLQRLSKGESFTLADLPDKVIDDITRVDDLREALEVSL